MKSLEAVIIKNRPFGEADEFISVMSAQGKIRLRARGVRKAQAKLRGPLQRLNWLEVWFVEGKTSPLVTDATLKESFPGIRNNLLKMRAAFEVFDFIDDIVPPVESSQGSISSQLLWWQLLEYLNGLEYHQGKESFLALAPLFFVYRILQLDGHEPSLQHCSICGQPIKRDDRIAFSPSAGGVIDEKCLKVDPTAISFSHTSREVLVRWKKSAFSQILNDNAALKETKELKKVIVRFTAWHLGTPAVVASSNQKIL